MNDTVLGQIETPPKKHKFYPLVLFNDDGKRRWISRNTEFDKKHNPLKLHILYGRQLGKLNTHKFNRTNGKSSALMELPYSTEINCDAISCDCELEYLRRSPDMTKRKPVVQHVDGMAIIDEELGH